MPYALPIASLTVIIISVLFFRPQLTAFAIANPSLNAEIKITANQILPQDASIHIFLEKDGSIAKDISASTIDEFVKQFSEQSSLQYKSGKNDEIGYEGYGYTGSQIFNIRLDTSNLKGKYILKTQIFYQSKPLSETQQEIEIWVQKCGEEINGRNQYCHGSMCDDFFKEYFPEMQKNK